jgi:transposase
MNDVTTYGLDLAKRVFQVHWVDVQSGEVHRKTLPRTQVSVFFARAPRGVVAMEACGSAHHWGRLLQTMGHAVKLIAAQFVRPFVKTNKTDAADAQAIWEAAQRPEMRFVALKSEQQQAVLSLHRLRAQWVKVRTLQANQIRGLLYEFGVVVPLGWRALLNVATEQLTDPTEGSVPVLLRDELLKQLQALRDATARIVALEKQLASWQRTAAECQRIMPFPASVCSLPPRSSPAWRMRNSSARRASSPPISAWYRASRGPAGGSSCWVSANAVTLTCARCSYMAPAQYC